MFFYDLSSSNVPMFQCSNKKNTSMFESGKIVLPLFWHRLKKRQKGQNKSAKRWGVFFFRPFLIAPPLNTWGSGLRGAPSIWFLLRKKYTPTGWTDKNRNPPKNNHWVTFAVFWWRWKIPLSFWTTSIWKLMEVTMIWHMQPAQRTWHGRSMTYIILQPYKSLRCSNLYWFLLLPQKNTTFSW